ncbi:hypothetical protein [Caldimonas thermodepolymerans]|uniref:hypothetical protein n=1 Tax=Caldimonas thermodepolymerans TaxID=215580 RepID=UPI0024931901|nr:hypothetical protein [Caldimonas thermodepolymerans]
MARLVANLAVTDIDRRALGIAPILEEHMKRVNGWSDRQLAEAIERAYEVWEQRCEWNWTVDLSWLEESGYVYV